MKKTLTALTFLVLCFGASFASETSAKTNPQPEDFHIVTIYELNDNFDTEIEDLSLLAVKFPEGAQIKLKGVLSGDFIELSSDNDQLGTIKVKQPFYCRIVEDDILASSDLLDWESFSDFVTGQLDISASADIEGPVINIKLDVNKKD